MTLRTEELAAQIKPYVIKWMQNMVLQDTIGRHELGGSLHTGQISDSQAPQFLKTDGSRALSGNLAVSEFTTIDGVDLDVFLSSFDLHTLDPDAHHDAVTVLDSDTINLSLSGQQVSGSVLFGDGILGGVGGIRPDWATGASGLSAASLNAPGSATSVARGDHTHQITTTDDPDGVTATILKSTTAGLLTLRGLTLRGDLMPFSPDGANIGSSSYPFLTGHISEMYGQRFVEETIQVAGGHWIIPQSSATLAADMDGSTTTMTLTENQAWEANDYLVMRDIDKVEYFKVVSGSGTTWTVERNKDTSGANTWGVGAVVANIGKNGEGWLEAQGGGVPGFSVWRRTGNNYSDSLEVARLGELTNWQSAGLTGVGLGIGSVAGNEYLTYTPSAGLAVRGTIRADDGYLQNLTVQGLLSLNTSGELRAGTATDGLRFGYLTDGYYLRGISSDVTQVEIKASDGKLYAGGGKVTLDANGMSLKNATTTGNKEDAAAIKFYDHTGSLLGDLAIWYGLGGTEWSLRELHSYPSSGSSAFLGIDNNVRISDKLTVLGNTDFYDEVYSRTGIRAGEQPSVPSAPSSGAMLYQKKTPVFLRSDGSKIPVMPCPPWEAMRSFSQIIGSYCPLYSVGIGGVMKDSSYAGRDLTPNPSASTIPLNDDETISDYLIYLRANGSVYYSNTAQGTARNGAGWATILVWFKPTSINILQGLLQFGHTTQNIAAYITAGNKLVVDFTSTGGVTQVISTNSVNLNEWNYAILRFQGGGGTSFINLNGTVTSVTSKAGNLISAVGEFRYGQQPGYAGYFSGVLGFLTFGDYASSESYDMWVDMSRPWHGH